VGRRQLGSDGESLFGALLGHTLLAFPTVWGLIPTVWGRFRWAHPTVWWLNRFTPPEPGSKPSEEGADHGAARPVWFTPDAGLSRRLMWWTSPTLKSWFGQRAHVPRARRRDVHTISGGREQIAIRWLRARAQVE